MSVRIIKIGLLCFFVCAFSRCEKFEARGFFASYESANQRFEQSMEWNNIHPYKEIVIASDNYTLFVMADSHVGGTKNLDQFLDEAIRKGVSAVIMAGDLTSGHTKDYAIFKEHLPDQDTINIFSIVGNHDLYFDGWKQFYSLFGSTTYLFTIKTPQASDLFVCLDTGGGTLGSKQLDWLTEVLENERANYRRCVIFTHNNIFRIRHTTSTNPFVEEIHALLELCIKHEVDMVIAGHDHKRNEVAFGNTIHLTLDALQDDSPNSGYLRLTIEQGNIEYQFITIE
jgi:predicted phosphodiesterase